MKRWDGFVHTLLKIEWTEIALACCIFIVFLLFRKWFTKYIFKMMIAILRKTPTELFTNVLLAFERPLHFLWIVLGLYFALMYLPFDFTTTSFVGHLFRTLIILLIGWGMYNYMSTQSVLFMKLARNFDIDDDSIFIPFISKVMRFIVIALVIVVIASEWEYNINGFVAGLGLGGLAFALAAQETIANFFGGIVIIMEKPFAKGHWIETPTVEGVVEDIGFRSTEVRTFADALVTVPNSIISKEPITNWSVMQKRRITFSIGVAYGTPREKLETCIRRIEALLKGHDGVDQDYMIVRFDEFSEPGMNIYLYFFTKTIVWAEWFKIKENISFAIMDIFAEEGVSLAVPIVEIKEKDTKGINES